ncbi:MAG: YIP1 family protein [Syntrophaceae bacterium]|nr:YIP1 family protein [Syntrophaceae bacterium]
MEPKSINFTAIPQTAVNVVTKPSEFFQGMPKSGGFLEPLVFLVIMGLIGGVIQAVINFIGFGPYAAYGGAMISKLDSIIFTPILLVIGSFIAAAILFAIWKLMGSQENYETAYRCGAYMTALVPITAIIGAVPYVGGVINMVIYVFFLVTASIYVHKLPSRKVWLVFGIIGVILAVMTFVGEYRIRHASSEMNKWMKMGEDIQKEYQNNTEDMQKAADEMRKQAEKMAEQFQKQAQEAKE